MEAAEKAGVPDATQYIRFYNLRNYDRINAGPGTAMDQVQKESGVDYESGRKQHDDIVGAGYDGRGEGTGAYYGRRNPEYEEYQRAGKGVYDEMVDDSVAECYMENGPSILNVAWTGSEEAEMDAFVSEGMFLFLSPIPSRMNSLTRNRAIHSLQNPHSRRPHCNNRLREPQRPLPTRIS